jgi:hypothetical protein
MDKLKSLGEMGRIFCKHLVRTGCGCTVTVRVIQGGWPEKTRDGERRKSVRCQDDGWKPVSGKDDEAGLACLQAGSASRRAAACVVLPEGQQGITLDLVLEFL